MRSKSSHFMARLALIDFVLCAMLIYPAFHEMVVDSFIFTRKQCLAWLYVFVLLTAASIYTITVISLDRYLGVIEPLRRAMYMKSKGALKMMGGVCVAAFILALPILLQLVKPRQDDDDDTDSASMMRCHQQLPLWYMVVQDLVMFLLPLVTMGEAYRRVSREVTIRSKMMASGVVPLYGTSEMTNTDLYSRTDVMRVHRGYKKECSQTLIMSRRSSSLQTPDRKRANERRRDARQLRENSGEVSVIDEDTVCLDCTEFEVCEAACSPDKPNAKSGRSAYPSQPSQMAFASATGSMAPHNTQNNPTMHTKMSMFFAEPPRNFNHGFQPSSPAPSGNQASSSGHFVSNIVSAPKHIPKESEVVASTSVPMLENRMAKSSSSSNVPLTARTKFPTHGILVNRSGSQSLLGAPLMTIVEQEPSPHKASTSSATLAATIREEPESGCSNMMSLPANRVPEPRPEVMSESLQHNGETSLWRTQSSTFPDDTNASGGKMGSKLRFRTPRESKSRQTMNRISWLTSTGNASSSCPKFFRGNRGDTKARVTLTVLLVMFVVFWLPYFLLMPLCLTFGQRDEDWLITELCAVTPWWGLCHSFVNPCIYAWAKPDYRRALVAVCCCKVQKMKQVGPFAPTRGPPTMSTVHIKDRT
ncbi:dopamine D2-like receptor [Littorina saxatilis]